MKKNQVWFMLVGLVAMLALALGQAQRSASSYFDNQFGVAITGTAATTIVPALTGRAGVVTMLELSTDTEQAITVSCGATTWKTYYIPAYGPGVIAPPGHLCVVYGQPGEAITVTCSAAAHNTSVAGLYKYR